MTKQRLRLVKSDRSGKQPAREVEKPFNLERFKSKHQPTTSTASASATPTSRSRRRPWITEEFAPITYTLAHKLQNHRVSGTAWFLLVALDRLIYQPGGRSPLKLTAETLASLG